MLNTSPNSQSVQPVWVRNPLGRRSKETGLWGWSCQSSRTLVLWHLLYLHVVFLQHLWACSWPDDGHLIVTLAAVTVARTWGSGHPWHVAWHRAGT